MENRGAESPSLTQIKCLRVFGTQGTPAPQSQPPGPWAWWTESLRKGDPPAPLAGAALRADPAVSTAGAFQPLQLPGNMLTPWSAPAELRVRAGRVPKSWPGVRGPWGSPVSEPGGRGGGGSRPWWRRPESARQAQAGQGSSRACLIPLLLGMPISPSPGCCLSRVVREAQPRNTGRAALHRPLSPRLPCTCWSQGLGGQLHPRLGPGPPPGREALATESSELETVGIFQET